MVEPECTNVEAIWQKLKAKRPGRALPNERLVQGILRGKDTNSATDRSAGKCGGLSEISRFRRKMPRSASGTEKSRRGKHDTGGGDCGHHAAITMEDFEKRMQREVALIQEDCLRARKGALHRIKAFLQDAAASSEPQNEAFQDATAGFLGKALIRRFDDGNEQCRELAIDALARSMEAVTDSVLPLLPYLIPVLEERLQINDHPKLPVEPSEEVRLKLSKMLVFLIRESDKAIAAYASEVVRMVEAGCSDDFHEINIVACECLNAMNDVLGLRLYNISKQLVATAMPLTTHKRQKVRIAAIRAVKQLMHQGAHEMILEITSFRDPNVVPIKAFYGEDLKVNFCGKLASDVSSKVRLEFLNMIGDWMLNLRERTDHESRLLPYVLSALNDESPEVAACGAKILEDLGAQYETEHKEELKDKIYYLPEQAHGLGWGSEQAVESLWESARTNHHEGEGGRPSGSGRRQIFFPFSRRPRLGARLLMQANFSQMVKAMCCELSSWQVDIRARTLPLLRSCLLLLEDHVAGYLPDILESLIGMKRDGGGGLELEECCVVMGCFINPTHHLDILQPKILDEGASVSRTAAVLWILGYSLRGSGMRSDFVGHTPRLLNLIDSPSFHRSQDTNAASACLEVIHSIVSSCKHALPDELQATVVGILLNLNATKEITGACADTSSKRPDHVLEEFSRNNREAPEHFIARHRERLLTEFVGSEDPRREEDILYLKWVIHPNDRERMERVWGTQGKHQEDRGVGEWEVGDTKLLTEGLIGLLPIAASHPDSFSKLLASCAGWFELLERIRYDEHSVRTWVTTVLPIAIKTQHELCMIQASNCLRVVLSRIEDNNAEGECLMETMDMLCSECVLHSSPDVRLASCRCVGSIATALRNQAAQSSTSVSANQFPNSVENILELIHDSEDDVRALAVGILIEIVEFTAAGREPHSQGSDGGTPPHVGNGSGFLARAVEALGGNVDMCHWLGHEMADRLRALVHKYNPPLTDPSHTDS